MSILDILRQSGYTDEEKNKLLQIEKDYKENNGRKAKELMGRNQDISANINIPSRLKVGELDQKVNVHPNFKNYDHSLEKVRKSFKAEDDGVEFGEGSDENGIIDRGNL